MTVNRRHKTLLRGVLLRVLPAATLLFVVLSFAANSYIQTVYRDQLVAKLTREAEFSAVTIATRLDALVASANGLASNHLIINGLVDVEARHAYLPIFFTQLQIAAPDGTRVYFVDYRGRVIASNSSNSGDPEPALLRTVSPQQHDLTFDRDGLLLVVPVLYEGSMEGAIVVRMERSQLTEFFAFSPTTSLGLVSYKNEILFQSEDPQAYKRSLLDRDQRSWIRNIEFVPGYAPLKVTIAESATIAFAPIQDVRNFMLLFVVLMLAGLTGGIFVTAYLSAKPLVGFVSRLREFTTASDLNRRIEPTGSAEYRDLASSFNAMLERLQKVVVSHDRLAKENKFRQNAEKALRDREAATRAIVETVLEGIITIDASGIIDTFNPAAAAIFGYEPDEVIGRNVKILMPDPYRSGHDGFIRNYLKGNAPKVIGTVRTVEGKRKDGSTFPMELAVSSMEVADGVMFTGVVRDISDRLRAEREIEESRTRLIDAIESLPDGFALYDADDRLVICNEKYRSFYEISPGVARPGTEFIDILRDGLNNGIYADAVGREEQWLDERKKKHRALDGQIEQRLSSGRWLRVLEHPTSSGGTVGVRVDITEQKRHAVRLEASEARLRATIAAAIDCVILTNGDGEIIEFNPAAENTFMHSRNDALGMDVDDLIRSPERHDFYRQTLKTYLRTGGSGWPKSRVEITGIRSDGDEFPIELAVAPIILEEDRAFVAFIRDLTEQRRIDRMKNEFISVVSHELRTPLTSLSGSIRLVTAGTFGALPDKAQSLLEIANRNVERLNLLVNDILDVEKIKSNRMEFDFTTSNIAVLAEKAVAENAAYGAKFDVRLTLEDNLKAAHAEIDEFRMAQVLANLLSNAVKFSPAGSEVILRLSRHKGMLRIAVVDSGCGIPEEMRDRLFDRFFQIDASDSRSKQGSGLGLTIVKSIVERHGSRIHVESTPGEGSTFYFDLAEVEQSATVETSTQSSQEAG